MTVPAASGNVLRNAPSVPGSRATELLLAFILALFASPTWSQGAADLLVTTPTTVLASSPSSPGVPIGFGASLALDEDLLVVGAPDERLSTDSSVVDVGAVYVYERDGNGLAPR